MLLIFIYFCAYKDEQHEQRHKKSTEIYKDEQHGHHQKK
jgi:hypothetical protein